MSTYALSLSPALHSKRYSNVYDRKTATALSTATTLTILQRFSEDPRLAKSEDDRGKTPGKRRIDEFRVLLLGVLGKIKAPVDGCSTSI